MARSDQTAEKLRFVMRALLRRVRAESTGQPLSAPQTAVLRRLDVDGPTTTADLARRELIKPQSMGALVAGLEAAGLVARKDDATDARRRLVALTRAGRRTLDDRRAARQSWLSSAIDAELDAGEQRTLVAALELLRRIAES